jgi:hypothetical protein
MTKNAEFGKTICLVVSSDQADFCRANEASVEVFHIGPATESSMGEGGEASHESSLGEA